MVTCNFCSCNFILFCKIDESYITETNFKCNVFSLVVQHFPFLSKKEVQTYLIWHTPFSSQCSWTVGSSFLRLFLKQIIIHFGREFRDLATPNLETLLRFCKFIFEPKVVDLIPSYRIATHIINIPWQAGIQSQYPLRSNPRFL